MAAIEKKTKRYPSDLTDEEWSAIWPFLPAPAGTGRKRRTDLREVLNAIRYMVRSGCEWRMLPIHFPPWQTVYWWFRRFVRLLLFRTIHDVALMIDRERSGRDADPSAAIIDSQSIKAPAAAGTRGFDGAKKIVGRKRHIAVDTDGHRSWSTSPPPTSPTAPAHKPSSAPCASAGPGSNICSPTGPMIGVSCSTSSSKSFAAMIRASRSCRDDGLWNAPSDGSPDTDASWRL